MPERDEELERRAGELKMDWTKPLHEMDWTKPLHDARAMGIEWLQVSEGRQRTIRQCIFVELCDLRSVPLFFFPAAIFDEFGRGRCSRVYNGGLLIGFAGHVGAIHVSQFSSDLCRPFGLGHCCA